MGKEMRKKESGWIILSSIGTVLIAIGTFMLVVTAWWALPKAANDALRAANKNFENKQFAYALEQNKLSLEVSAMLKDLVPNSNITESNNKEKILERIQILKPKLEALTGNTEELDKIANSYKALEKSTPSSGLEIRQDIKKSIEQIDKKTINILKRSRMELNTQILDKKDN